MNYEQDMYIDENALDYEILEQPSLMAKYSRLLAEAKQDRDIVKEKLDYEKAKLDKEIRSDPGEYDIAKITESAITNAIISQDSYREIVEEYNDMNFEVNVLQGIVSALEHRKSALEMLVKLYGQNYFAGPSIPHDLSQIREDKNSETSHNIGKSLKRTKKSKS